MFHRNPDDAVAVVTTAAETLEVRPAESPAPAPGEAVIETIATGICGSDLHLFSGDHPYARYPLIQGHEVVGRVSQVGDPSDRGLVGALVAVEPTAECGACRECRRGAINRCEHLQVLGVQIPGSLAGRFAARTAKLHPVPDDDDPARWALVEPVAIASHAVARSRASDADTVVVLGGGVIGLAIQLALRPAPPNRVVLVEPNRARREFAQTLDFGEVVAPDELETALATSAPSGADVIFEATGVPSVLSGAHRFACPGGEIVVVGQSSGDFSMPVIEMTRKELTLTGTRNSVGDFPTAIRLLREYPQFAEIAITHRFPIGEAASAFSQLTTPGTAALKILLTAT